MAEGRSAARRVLRLQARLGRAQEPREIIKALKGLQDLDITLDILVETGIGKTVNSLRKHATAGNVAKSLINQWKKLIPSESESGHRGKKQSTEKEKYETKSSISKENKPSEKSKASVQASKSSPISKKLNKEHTRMENKHRSRDSESQKESDSKECSSSGSKHASQGTNPKAKKSIFKETVSADSKKLSDKQHSVVANKDLSHLKEKTGKGASKQRNPKHVRKPKQKPVLRNKAELPSDEEFESPTMSFESYLNYDQVTNKRKRKACSTSKQPKKHGEQRSSSSTKKTSKFPPAKEEEENVQKSEDDPSETPSKKAKMASLQDLLNTPLPKFLPDISVSSPPYAAEFKGRQVKMAYMNSVAKPPRNIRRQQEIHGTAGSVTQLHPMEKYKTRIPEIRDRNNTSSNPNSTSNGGSSSSSGVTQDGKKPVKRIAPIMRKTLKAFKNTVGRR
ncbi:elongin-A-like isoform X2 [Dromaius novaehollandiae]|uniref:elongin-A-like isoform X2 n=1 Tax=Dromaius novaehollandiae TaxID=8790 RepID=UPI00311EE8FA